MKPEDEAILYEPANLKPGNATNLKELVMYYSRAGNRTNPFEDALFVRNAIASGSIVPPEGESAAVRRQDWWVGFWVLLFLGAGTAAFLWGMLWK